MGETERGSVSVAYHLHPEAFVELDRGVARTGPQDVGPGRPQAAQCRIEQSYAVPASLVGRIYGHAPQLPRPGARSVWSGDGRERRHGHNGVGAHSKVKGPGQ